ncbi:MAG: BamA/TamA family outer membrane protein [Alistipes sp.]|nr:BamA/TamA family outer membrane protein [Alistipes sp.]
MRKFFALAVSAILFVSTTASAEPKIDERRETRDERRETKDERKSTTEVADTKKQTVKKGWNFAPFPSIGYNSDTGFQIGALCEIFDYGDGSTYPAYKHKFNVDLSWTTKDQVKLHFFYDSKYLIPKVRLTFAATYILAQMYPFMGFNGAAAPYFTDLASGKKQMNRVAMYNVKRNSMRIMADFQGDILPNFRWAAGISYWWYDVQNISLKKKGKTAYDSTFANDYLTNMGINSPSLWQLYQRAGLINANEAHGGHHLELKAGLVYDSREHEADPTRGIWAELYAYGSPDILNGRGKDGYHYLKLAAHFRHYVPVWQDKITFAYHLAYQGKLAGNAPYYTLQNINTLYLRQIISDGLGSINTVRGVPYNSVIGDGYAWANIEMRFKIVSFRFIKQNFYLATNPFFDIGGCVQPYRLDEMKKIRETGQTLGGEALTDAELNLIYTGEPRKVHMSAGLGLKLAMNRNFILSAEVAVPLNTKVYTNTNLNVPVSELKMKNSYKPGVNIGLNYIF